MVMDLLSLLLSEWAVCGGVIVLTLYILGTWNYGHFSSRGLEYHKPVPFLGCMAPLVFRKKSFTDFHEDIYKKHKDQRMYGVFMFFRPILFVNDPEIIKRITVKDFDHFLDHQPQVAEKADPILEKNLFSLKGQKWRDMRATLSPAFTSSKMKAMFNFMNSCGQQLGDYVQEEIRKHGPGQTYKVDMKDLFTRFTNDVIATSAFGIHIDSLKVKDNEFYLMGKEMTNFGGVKFLIFCAYLLCPKFMELLNVRLFSKAGTDFFSSLVHDTITTREREGIVRPDMIHLLMQARRGELKAEAGEEDAATDGGLKTNKMSLTEEDITGQALVFFFAGFETASTLLSFTALLLATHEDVQQRLQEELDDLLGDSGKLTYEKVQQMKYLDMVLSETMRLYPSVVALDRRCVKDYTIPASGNRPEYTIKKGEGLWIPVYGLHHNPEYFPEPEKFDPERFSDENKHNIKPFTYLPFGSGPRICIGQRFALLEAKVAFVHILSRFNLTVVDKTPLPIRISKKGFSMVAEGGFWLGVTPRQKQRT